LTAGIYLDILETPHGILMDISEDHR